MRKPNKEQKVAIEHSGGVILSAGAGSGKTFVLVEHIVYLGQKILDQTFESDQALSTELKKFFSQVVLMTYTKKAAGELAVRLKRRFKGLIEERPDEKWELVDRAVDGMYVGTIHGFCFRLLSQGYFPEIGGDLSVINEVESEDRIARLYDKWFAGQAQKLRSDFPDLYDIFLSSRDDVIKSLRSIFGQPDLRLTWQSQAQLPEATEYLESFDSQIVELLGLADKLKAPIDMGEYLEKTKSTWPRYLEMFQNWYRDPKRFEPSFFEKYMTEAKSLKARKPTSKAAPPEVIEYYEAVKNYYDFYKKIFDDIIAFSGDSRDVLKNYYAIFRGLVETVESSYDPSEGLTFSDLEYSVLKGLDRNETRERISASYSYFIVDEFQDTSQVQFEILRKLVNDDFHKLFCVGDVKQAIYAFRGGEVSVFRHCQEALPESLSLVSNYRSFPNIINFNNDFFKALFSMEQGYERTEQGDRFSVPVEAQTVPEGVEFKSSDLKQKISKTIVDIQSSQEKKPSEPELNYIEADALFKQIQKKMASFSPEGEDICVLYKNLGPSLFLIEKLLHSDFTFRAQVKVAQNEDPLISLFNLALTYILSPEDKVQDRSTLAELFSLHLEIMGGERTIASIENSLESFHSNVSEWGVGISFEKLLFSLGVANSNYSNNKSLIDSIIKVSMDDPEACWERLSQINANDKYSIEFQLQGQKGRVIIMTTHASKGLQFDHILLGGIQTNGRAPHMREDMGKMPGSFKWRANHDQGTKFLTPQMILEKEQNKLKDFSEHKRLFYVACTRAVKSIHWTEMSHLNKEISYHKNSWVRGLYSYQLECGEELNEILDIERIEFSLDKQIADDDSDGLVMPPFFHRDYLGIQFRNGEAGTAPLALMSELSVTRLSSVVECPRKFYLSNILKLDPEDLLPSADHSAESSEKFREEAFLRDSSHGESLSELPPMSNAERGTLLHQEISEYIKRKGLLPRKYLHKDSPKILEWLSGMFPSSLDSEKFNYISEVPIKFSLFGHMISGIPDLVITDSSGQELEVWDFKTGRKNSETEKKYQFQLYCYAYALSHKSPSIKTIKLSLCYVDEKKLTTSTIFRDEITAYLREFWGQTNLVDKINKSHCDICAFGNLCHS